MALSLEEIKQSEWYLERPQVIKEAVDKVPPNKLYRMKETGKQCYILSYEESDGDRLEDVTCTVQKTGIGGLMESLGLGDLDTNQVFGVFLNSLEPWETIN
jgi:hypothetical protein